MKYLRVAIFVSTVLFSLNGYGQSYRITKLSYEDGLINKSGAGFFQDSKGVVWLANGNGFTRLYGDHFDQVKADRFVFKWGNFRGAKTVGNKIYWSSSYVHGNTIDYINHGSYEIHTYTESTGRSKILMTHAFVDKFEYFWSFEYDKDKDSLSILRYVDGDTTDVVNMMKKIGVSIQPIHHVLSENYWYRLSGTENFKEDNKRNLWFNTHDGELARLDFEARSVKIFTNIPHMADVLVDADNNYWVSVYPTEDNPNPGIFCINENGDRTHYNAQGESTVFLNKKDSPYIVDHNGIYRFNSVNFDTVFQKQHLYDFQIDSKERIYGKWHDNDTTEIFVINSGNYHSIMRFPEQFLHSDVLYMVDREDILWISSRNGVYKCLPSDLSISVEPVTSKSANSWYPTFTARNGDNYYVRDEGLYVQRDVELHFLTKEKVPPQAGFGEDSDGNVYFVTGVPNPDDPILYSFPDLLENVYKVKPNLTVEKCTTGSLKNAVHNESFFRVRIRYFNDELFLLTDEGVHYKKVGDPFSYVAIDTSFFDSKYCEKSECYGVGFHIYTLAKKVEDGEEVDAYGWGKKYTLKFDLSTKRFEPFNEVSDTLDWTGSQFYSIPNGWLGFAKQCIVVKQGSMYQYFPYDEDVIEGIWKRPVSWIKPLFAGDGNIYYTGKGMGILSFNYKTGKFYQKKVKDGLLISDISSIFFDPDTNFIFASSSFGLQQIERLSINSDGPLKIKKTWTPSTGYTGAVKHKFIGDSILNMWSGDGLAYTFDLVGNYRTKETPTIFFTGFQLNNDTVNWNNFSCDLHHSNYADIPNQIQFKHDQNHLTFFFQGISHLDEKQWYEYQLRGLQNDWIKTENKSVSYPELKPGNYEFQVKAVNEIGASQPVSIKFSIAKPWYQTALARIIFVLLILGGFFAFFRVRTAALRRRQVVLENKVDEATVEIKKQKEAAEHQRDLVEEKNKEILDSITYAKRLQTAILPPQKLVKEWLNDSFILYKPKDIVAGDFYWMETAKRNGRNVIFYAAADCTGHGVPGAMVSVVCSNALKRAVKEFDIADPGELLDKVAEIVRESFEQSEHEVKDGMDIAVCAIDLMDRTVWFSGAHNSLYRITGEDTKVPENVKVLESGNRKLIEYSANKQPVGNYEYMEPFKTIEIQLEPGDCIYLFSDGFADQFGGDKGKKFKYKPFKQLLLDIEDKEMDSQKDILDTAFERWKGSLEQVDDVCIIGLRVNGHMRKLFSKRELEVIKKIKEGRQSKEIADEMNIAKSTVDTYRKRILAKTNLNNAAELIKFCDEHEIL
ncbi:MAG: SpoIIE family protein phosphatase [Crocinitomicaceae bacterium]|nr:SpoIIE family protein phosphatase [Crocinitomicaceae bacterium]